MEQAVRQVVQIVQDAKLAGGGTCSSGLYQFGVLTGPDVVLKAGLTSFTIDADVRLIGINSVCCRLICNSKCGCSFDYIVVVLLVFLIIWSAQGLLEYLYINR